jgi:lysophospholipase L1-like esterase
MSQPAPTPSTDAASDPETKGALRRLGLAALAAALVALVPYVVPQLERMRPWVPGEDVPLARLLQGWQAQLPAFAGAGDGYQAAAPRSQQRLADELGAAVAANLEPAEGRRRSRSAPAAAPDGPAEGMGETLPPAVRIDPREYAGIEVEIEDPRGRGLAAFYASLLSTARRDKGALSRIAHYGDSSIATDLITHTVRRSLQHRFGDGGHGFLLIARGHMPWGHRDVTHHSGGGWVLREITRGAIGDGRYGYGGVQYRGVSGSWARFATAEDTPVGDRVSRFDIYYQKGRRGGRLRAEVRGGERRDIDTRSRASSDVVESIQVPDGEHELHLRVLSGEPVLYGVVMEREGPGVVYDSLGLVGARARRLLNYDADHIARQLAHRGVDLLIVGFGGNEADDPLHRLEGAYEEEFVQVLQRMRGGQRDMGCLVFAPLDQARRDERGRVTTLPTVPAIVEAQRRAAHREGCAFWDTFQAMGGEGAMERWYRTRPRLALGDFRHATPAGYEAIGNMFYKALLKDFARYLSARK